MSNGQQFAAKTTLKGQQARVINNDSRFLLDTVFTRYQVPL